SRGGARAAPPRLRGAPPRASGAGGASPRDLHARDDGPSRRPGNPLVDLPRSREHEARMRGAMAADAEVAVRTSEASHLRIAARVREVASRRETLLNLVRKELKVKYAQSVLGAIWSLLNPIVFLAVFSFVMRITNNQFSDYPVYLLSGLLAWNLCSVSLTTGARSVIDNANLVKKVAFPREILPLSAIGVALVDFVLQSAVLF